MSTVIDFYFDFTSPYGYLAAEQLSSLSERTGCTVIWHPVLLGAVFKVTGSQPLSAIPLKGDYSLKDFRRSAAYYGIAYKAPSRFPLPTQNAARAMLWIQAAHPKLASEFALAVYRALFVEDRDISSLEVVGEIGSFVGVDAAILMAAAQTDEIKNQLKLKVEEAIAKGAFGSPYFIVNGEPFWGADRLPMLEKWVSDGPWKY